MGARGVGRAGIAGLYVASAIALALAPLFMPPTYSWLEHTTSESAAQGLDGAWLARTGFLIFGFAVIATSLTVRWWSAAARVAHMSFGICMIAAATFSSRPADPARPFVAVEDTLHSVAATVMGFAFAIGVVVVAGQRLRDRHPLLILDGIALVAAIVIPLGMVGWNDRAGVAQRLMFAIAFAWYIAATVARPPATTRPPTDRNRPRAAPGRGARPRARAAG